MVVERVEMHRLFRATMDPAIGLFIGGKAIFEDLHDAIARAFDKGAQFRAIERARSASADRCDCVRHAFLTVMASQLRST